MMCILIKIYIIYIFRFCFVFAITIPFDIRDIAIDFKNIKTIPIRFGEKISRYIGVLYVYQSINYVETIFIDFITFQIFYATIVLSFFTIILIIQSSSKRDDIYFSFGVESK